ncbi:MAG: restriction endonuclease [Gammaproteobacteria bacterium]|nr:restriction endonuclease [Gammaproteobacteria bacterium]
MSLFRSANFRSAINLVPEYKREDVVSAAKGLLQREDTLASESSDKLLKERVVISRKEAAKFFIKYVNDKWGPHQFEENVGEAFERKGYERVWGNSTRNGGDADHVFCLPISGIDELDVLDRTPLLIVQVKHKRGRDYNDVKGVNQLVKWALNDNEKADYTVLYKILFSSADSFTDECKKIAEKNDIMLICGTEAGQFML